MGKRGPPPKPTALRVLSGNASKRRINHEEPILYRGLPDAYRSAIHSCSCAGIHGIGVHFGSGEPSPMTPEPTFASRL
jgi:hypothetical protein